MSCTAGAHHTPPQREALRASQVELRAMLACTIEGVPMSKCFGVMRHARSFRAGMEESKRSESYPSLTKDGVSATWLVGARFKEFLDQWA